MSTGKLTPKDRLKVLEMAHKASKGKDIEGIFARLMGMLEGNDCHTVSMPELAGTEITLPAIPDIEIHGGPAGPLDDDPGSDEPLDLPPMPGE